MAGRSVQSYNKLSFFSIFNCLRPFPQDVGQVKERLILELHEMRRVSHVVACPMDFNLLCDRGQQGGVLKPTKNHFQVFLAVILRFLNR